MRLIALFLALVTATSTGCYFGRSASARSGAKVANGMLVATGGALVLGALLDSGSCGDATDGTACGLGRGLGNAAQAGFGLLLASAGGLGLLINATVSTDEPAPPPVKRTAIDGRVTAPGLRPATIQLH